MTGYVKTAKVEYKINNLMYLHIDDKKLLENYKAIWTKIEDLKTIKLNALPAYDGKYIKNIINTYQGEVYKNFRGLNVTEDDIECE